MRCAAVEQVLCVGANVAIREPRGVAARDVCCRAANVEVVDVATAWRGAAENGLAQRALTP
ncbi:hypothetical protein [Nonomuraea sp. NPDC050540]|uniref:hypothetical protein n=1 Tax=Nonomuraea sp. NPDC050540 TaxID=3364367 RepID=UPI0037B8352B